MFLGNKKRASRVPDGNKNDTLNDNDAYTIRV